MTSRRYPIIGLIFVLVLLIIGAKFFFIPKLILSDALNTFFERFSPCVDLKIRLTELEAENTSLRARLSIEATNPEGSIKVYSNQPFNNRSEIAIAAGSEDGLSEGDIFVYRENALVGKIKVLAPKVSIIKTIFDPSFEAAVRIGEGGIDALMKGGNELTLNLIAPTAILEEGSPVYTAGPEFPYGLTLGKLKYIERNEDGTYKRVSVEPTFEVKTLRNVFLYP